MRGFSRKFKYGFVVTALLLSVWTAVFAQIEPPAKPARPQPHAAPAMSTGVGTFEKSINVDASVNLSLCVTQGNLKVNGWNRNEVRVFVENGPKFDFIVQQKNTKTGDPVWIMLTSANSGKTNTGQQNECISGDIVEIDVPANATVNVKGQETTTVIDGVRRVGVKNAGGDITLRNIKNGITAATYRGDLTVEESAGAMNLETTNGNILVFEAAPSEIGDIFKVKTTSGAISLQKLGYRQVESNSISGTMMFGGELLSGGSYSFVTSNGTIRLAIPPNSSSNIFASYGFGNFNSEIPIKTITEDIHPGPVKNLNGSMGSGDATLRITTNNGSIFIKKL